MSGHCNVCGTFGCVESNHTDLENSLSEQLSAHIDLLNKAQGDISFYKKQLKKYQDSLDFQTEKVSELEKELTASRTSNKFLFESTEEYAKDNKQAREIIGEFLASGVSYTARDYDEVQVPHALKKEAEQYLKGGSDDEII